MKKSIYLFCCSYCVHRAQHGDPIQTHHSFTELVEIGDEPATVAFHNWITRHHDELKAKFRPQENPRPVLTYTYVLAP